MIRLDVRSMTVKCTAVAVQDDKGPTIGAVYALKAIRDLGLPIDRRIRVLFGM